MSLHRRVKLYSAAALVLTFAVTAAVLRGEGRIWFCACGQPRPWVSESDGPHTSQHFLDPYSLTHLQHGLLFFVALAWLLPDLSATTPEQETRAVKRRVLRFWIAALIECGWEAAENSPAVIERYRNATAAQGYAGDSVWNSLGDVASCVAGYLIAQQLGWRRTLLLFVAIEVALLFWIRDSLLLNVVMLLYPLEAIKQWQTAA